MNEIFHFGSTKHYGLPGINFCIIYLCTKNSLTLFFHWVIPIYLASLHLTIILDKMINIKDWIFGTQWFINFDFFSGSRELFSPLGGRCYLGQYIYNNNNHTRTVDPCTTCSCLNGYLTCRRVTCKPLLCAKQYQVSSPDQCCPVCQVSARDRICKAHGVIRGHGEVWKLDICSACTCKDGQVTCQVEPCQYLNTDCPPGLLVSTYFFL